MPETGAIKIPDIQYVAGGADRNSLFNILRARKVPMGPNGPDDRYKYYYKRLSPFTVGLAWEKKQ